jgi:hypothetical protein
VNYLDIPADAATAEMKGCAVVGANKGSGLGSLVGLAGGAGLSDFVQPDENGEIQIVILSQFEGWAEGETAGNVGTVDLNLFNGEQGEGEGEFLIDPRSFEEGTMNPLISFPGAQISATGQVSSPPARFALSLPILEGLAINIELASTQVLGEAYVDGSGIGLANGQLSGYLTRQAIIDLIAGIQAVCAGDMPPDFCDFVGGIIPPGSDPETALPLLLGLVGGFDAKVGEDGAATDCDPTPDTGDCNSVSVCLLVEMQGETIAGVGAGE